MFSDSKVAQLEAKLDIYEDLSREMLAKLENAVDKISEGNARIATILAKHDERIEQSAKSDDLIIKMIDEIKDSNEKNYRIIHGRIDKIQEEIKAFSKFRWQIGGVLIVAALLIGAGSRLAPVFLTPNQPAAIIERQ
jgi:transcriptional regulatory protein LevR